MVLASLIFGKSLEQVVEHNATCRIRSLMANTARKARTNSLSNFSDMTSMEVEHELANYLLWHGSQVVGTVKMKV